MKKEEALLLIEKAGEKDEVGHRVKERRSKRDLQILLSLMYYSHLKMAEALKVTPYQIDHWRGWVYSDKNNCNIVFEIPERAVVLRILLSECLFGPKHSEEPIIKTKKRALQEGFQELLSKAGMPHYRLTDILYAGGRDNPDVPKPYKEKEIERERYD